ncbi:MAG: hypothetical protein HZC01_05055 [Candidatus Kerfeldbacteria bacterium]|nr:hypothetical protein [Candidatus Kerfeldbacteria bacterium]
MIKSPVELSGICGNQSQFLYVSRIIAQPHDQPHAILLTGPEHVGKRFGLYQILHSIPKQSSLDFLSLTPAEEKSTIGVDQIRELQADISRRPLSGKYWVLIDDAALLTEESANALLKVLEEPRTNCSFFLITNSTERIPQTIRSRCLAIQFLPVATDEIAHWLRTINVSAGTARIIAAAAQGRPGIAFQYSSEPSSLSEWEERGRALCALMGEPIHARLQTVQTLLPAKSSTAVTRLIIEQWLGIIRDILLIQHHQRARINIYAEATLESLSARISRGRILNLARTLTRAFDMSDMPLQSKVLLENCVLSI